jgi:hypothetical protein
MTREKAPVHPNNTGRPPGPLATAVIRLYADGKPHHIVEFILLARQIFLPEQAYRCYLSEARRDARRRVKANRTVSPNLRAEGGTLEEKTLLGYKRIVRDPVTRYGNHIGDRNSGMYIAKDINGLHDALSRIGEEEARARVPARNRANARAAS